jgi:hypothetical protein
MKAEIGKSGEKAARRRSGKVNDRTLEGHKGCGTRLPHCMIALDRRLEWNF